MTVFASDKILQHADRLSEWFYKGSTRPITFEFDLTDACNHKCCDCAGGLREDKRFVDETSAIKVLDQIENFCGRAVIFTGGGEPLLHPRAGFLIEHAKLIGLDVGLITNGSIMDKKLARIILKHCTWVRISLDAGTAKMFERTHGVSKKMFWEVCKNIKMLTKMKKELGSKTTIGTGFLTGKDTIAGMDHFVQLSQELKVDYAQFRPYHNDFTKIDNKFLELKQKYETNIFKVFKSKHKYKHISDDILRPYQVCYGHNFATVICANLKVYLCCHLRGNPKYCLGDLNKNSLEEVWKGKQRKKVIETIDFKDCPPLCRCDSFNRLLWNLKQEKEHVNFL